MLEELKSRVMNVAKQAQRDGMCKHLSGNFSARDAKSGLVVITPTRKDRELLVVDDMVVTDAAGKVVENLTGLAPTSELGMHLRIYQERPDVAAVAHTHSPYATTFAVLDKPIPAMTYEFVNLGCPSGKVPVAECGRPGDPALAESIVDPIREGDAFLLRAHGSVAVSEEDVEGAYLRVCYLEELAGLYYRALVAGGCEPPAIGADELASLS